MSVKRIDDLIEAAKAKTDMDADLDAAQKAAATVVATVTTTATADDGLPVYDKNNDGVIREKDEVSFVDYVEGAQTDLEGLRHFDSNNDGVLDAADAEFAKFKVWQDSDQDGEVDAGELRTLTKAGIRSIDMHHAAGDDGVKEERDGNVIFGEGNYTKTDGTTAKFGDVAFATSDIGVKEIAGEVHFKAADGVVSKMKTALAGRMRIFGMEPG